MIVVVLVGVVFVALFVLYAVMLASLTYPTIEQVLRDLDDEEKNAAN